MDIPPATRRPADHYDHSRHPRKRPSIVRYRADHPHAAEAIHKRVVYYKIVSKTTTPQTTTHATPNADTATVYSSQPVDRTRTKPPLPYTPSAPSKTLPGRCLAGHAKKPSSFSLSNTDPVTSPLPAPPQALPRLTREGSTFSIRIIQQNERSESNSSSASDDKTPSLTAESVETIKDHRWTPPPAEILDPCHLLFDIVRKTCNVYTPFPDSKLPKGDIDCAELEYPGLGAKEKFPIVLTEKADEIRPMYDLIATVQMITRHCLPVRYQSLFGLNRGSKADITPGSLLANVLRTINDKDSEGLKNAVKEFNMALHEVRNSTIDSSRNNNYDCSSSSASPQHIFEVTERSGPAAHHELVTHALEQVYSRVVSPYSDELNNYKSWTSNVYGEINKSFVSMLIKQAGIKPHHVFLDLGSGIGNVVLQVAGQTLADCFGIEMMGIPARFAEQQRVEFLKRMRYYGKPCGKIRLKHGNMLEDAETIKCIQKADVILVNNYAFTADLNQKIIQMFLDLKDGAKVISLKSFIPPDRKLTLRNINSIESTLRTREYAFGRDSVSWMSEGGKYFIATRDTEWRQQELDRILAEK
ncbi:histone-lysine N-methyltransferase [Synchytrium endobioticum]|uniref:Histone-lysine N-methyltransferase, H3 lysine-79 specific n=1 Tax=Synchytrium endobioticum TaxID=286115 RepID=A0A507BWL5_9FUNG|nr:histone-lysine N-methyltransferase [Synchytrium endobioticum]